MPAVGHPLLAEALHRIRAVGSKAGLNIVAYSGGVDSSLVAALLYRVFPQNAYACIGVSPSLPKDQLVLARQVAHSIGIPLKEVATSEQESSEYIANRGQSCYHCKTSLYTALQAVAHHTSEAHPGQSVTLYNGTNADDRLDDTRVGLVAAKDFGVASPIDHLSKEQVRSLARFLDLPNWSHASSPCLRSRLAFGVPALEKHLQLIESAEKAVRQHLTSVTVQTNLRVRMLAGQRAMVEVDQQHLDEALAARHAIEQDLVALGFDPDVGFRPFRSGSLSRPSSMATSQ